MSTTLIVPGTKALAKDLRVNKTQAVMAAEERYKQRVRVQIDKLNYTKLLAKFKKDMKGDLKSLQEKITADITKKTGLYARLIDVQYNANTTDEYEDLSSIIWEADFIGVEIYEEIYFVNSAPPWFSNGTITLFKRVATRVKEQRELYQSYNGLQYKIGFNEMVKVRKALKEQLKSSQQLSDMQVVNAVLSQKDHVKDIDTVLDALLVD